MNEEKKRVESCAKKADYSGGVMQYTTTYCGMIFKKHMKEGTVLELGPAEGVMTNLLYPSFHDYTIVDGADFFVRDLQKRFPNIKAYTSLFEDFKPDRYYDNIILGHVLEHVENPCDILKYCSSWLTKGGKILAAVPNANSIHRQAAVCMGLLTAADQLNSTDKKNGHRRVYNIEQLKSDFENAGLNIIKLGGYWLKPLSNSQIEDTWSRQMIDAFLQLGEKYPDIAAEIYIVAE